MHVLESNRQKLNYKDTEYINMRRKPPYTCVCGESFTNMEDLTHHKEWACDRILKQRKKID